MNQFTTIFQLSGLHCESCKKITEKRAAKITGVIEATTNLVTGALTILANREISKQEIETIFEGTNYKIK
jgi:cation transport ATPase